MSEEDKGATGLFVMGHQCQRVLSVLGSYQKPERKALTRASGKKPPKIRKENQSCEKICANHWNSSQKRRAKKITATRRTKKAD